MISGSSRKRLTHEMAGLMSQQCEPKSSAENL